MIRPQWRTPWLAYESTGRIHQIVTPANGTITYTYGSPCNAPAGAYATSLTRVDADGSTTTYSVAGSNGGVTTTTSVTDKSGNLTTYVFTPTSLTTGTRAVSQINHYQGSTTLLRSDLFCYNNTAQSGCLTATVSHPILQKSVYTTLYSSTIGNLTRESAYTYDQYGNTLTDSEYDYGSLGSSSPASSPTYVTTTVYGTWLGNTCGANQSNIQNLPCTVTITENGNTTAQTEYTYNSTGQITATNYWNGTAWIGSSATYYQNGSLKTSTDVSDGRGDRRQRPAKLHPPLPTLQDRAS